MVTRHILTAWLIVAAVSTAEAQTWFKGTVILPDSKVLSGQLSYQPNTDVIFVKMGGKEAVMVFPAFRVQSFSYFDTDAQVTRRFVPLKMQKGGGQSYQFYEVVVDGYISVLRQQLELWYTLRQATIEYDYFVVTEENLMPMNIFRRQVYPTLKKSSESLRNFARKNRINPYDVDDTIRFIRFYNAERSGLASAR